MRFRVLPISTLLFFAVACSTPGVDTPSPSAENLAANHVGAPKAYSYICGIYKRWTKLDERKVGTYVSYGDESALDTPQGRVPSSVITFEGERELIQAVLTADGRFMVYGRALASSDMHPLGEYRGPVLLNGYYQAVKMEFTIPGIMTDSYQIQCN